MRRQTQRGAARHTTVHQPKGRGIIVKGTNGARALLASGFVLSLVAGTGCMPLFPIPDPPSPFLTRSQAKQLLGCQDTIARLGRKLVNTQTTSVENCALDILFENLLFENGLISEEEYEDRLDRIRDKCDKGLRKVTKASTKFIDGVIDACDGVDQYILDDDLLRFQLLSEETDGSLNLSSISSLAGSICGIKSLIANQLVLFQIPRVMELFSHLGEEYIVIVDENDFQIGYVFIPLDERCIIPEA